jgi:hypothetical protein
MQYRFERESRVWVSSRALLDVWAYTSLAAERGISGPVEAALFSELERATPLAMAGVYDVLVYVPPVIPLQADDVRGADRGFQVAVDRRIRESIDRWRVAMVTVDVSDQDSVAALLGRLTSRAKS